MHFLSRIHEVVRCRESTEQRHTLPQHDWIEFDHHLVDLTDDLSSQIPTPTQPDVTVRRLGFQRPHHRNRISGHHGDGRVGRGWQVATEDVLPKWGVRTGDLGEASWFVRGAAHQHRIEPPGGSGHPSAVRI